MRSGRAGSINNQKLRSLENSVDSAHARGIFQEPVKDDEEPGHVPIADIIKANHIE